MSRNDLTAEELDTIESGINHRLYTGCTGVVMIDLPHDVVRSLVAMARRVMVLKPCGPDADFDIPSDDERLF